MRLPQATYNGKIVFVSELALKYGFTDVDGRIPGNNDRIDDRRNKVMKQAPVQWSLERKLPKMAARAAMGQFFEGAKKYTSKL